MDLCDNVSDQECKLSDNRSDAKKRAEDVRQIVHRRIDFTTTPMYQAAYALNPWYRAPYFSEDILEELQAVFCQTLGDSQGIKAYSVFQCHYLTGREVTDTMARSANGLEPHEWWKVFGGSMQSLGNIAMRLLSQVPPASACERNWSAYKFVYSEKSNRLGQKRPRDLVSVFRDLRANKRATAAAVQLAKDLSESDHDGAAGADVDDEASRHCESER